MSSYSHQTSNSSNDAPAQSLEDFLTPEQRWGEVAEILATIALRSVKKASEGVANENS